VGTTFQRIFRKTREIAKALASERLGAVAEAMRSALLVIKQ